MPASITELLDELDDREPDAAPAELSLLKGETMILEHLASRAPSLQLMATAGPCEGLVFEVRESGGTIGRLPDNPIYVPDGRLSRKHARIDYRDNAFWLTDLGSANGTTLNGRSVGAPEQLRAGDVIDLGATRLKVQLDPDSRTPTD
jgi:predicted component of type VI protein secretion system